jgi:hypothetical protein
MYYINELVIIGVWQAFQQYLSYVIVLYEGEHTGTNVM